MINDKAKTIYVIGAAGRTGMLFCRELKDAAKIVGAALPPEIEKIESRKIQIARGKNPPEIFAPEIISPDDFALAIKTAPPDFLWLATRNPVDKIVAFYYRHFAGQSHFPALILSQNGRSAIADARKGLKDALGQESDKVEIIRVSLINGVDLKAEESPSRELPPSLKLRTAETADRRSPSREATADRSGTSVIIYKLPIKLGFGMVDEDSKLKSSFDKVAPRRLQRGTTFGEGETLRRLKDVFKNAGVGAQEFRGEGVLAMENAKLFLNLIGMYSAAEGVPVGDGWRDKEIFKKEIAMLKEFVLAVKISGGGFADKLGGYPVKWFARLVLLPVWMLAPWRGWFAKVIAKGRNRPKDLSEIDYYNGEAARLGKEAGVATPVNEEVVAKAQTLKFKI